MQKKRCDYLFSVEGIISISEKGWQIWSLCLFLRFRKSLKAVYLFIFACVKTLTNLLFVPTLEIAHSPEQCSMAVHIISCSTQPCLENIERYVKLLHSLNLKGII